MNQRTAGILMALSGLALLILNALDYLLGWNQISSAISAIGLALAVIGALQIRRS